MRVEHVLLVGLVLADHVAELVDLVLELDEAIHALFKTLLLIKIPLSNIDLLAPLRFLLLYYLGSYGLLSLLLPLLVELLCLDLFFLDLAHLVRHIIKLSLKHEVLEWLVFLRELNADFASFVVEWAFEGPADYFWIDITMILIKVISHKWQRKLVIAAPFQPEAVIAFFCDLD